MLSLSEIMSQVLYLLWLSQDSSKECLHDDARPNRRGIDSTWRLSIAFLL